MESTTMWLVVSVLATIAILAIGAWMVVQRRRTERLRTQFGPEYARELERTRDRRQVEGKLDDRWKRVEHLHIRPLTPRDRARFIESWRIVQAQFVDNPGAAVAEADRLLADVMATRGYPTTNTDLEQRAADISVDHANVAQNYRTAHNIAVLHAHGKATTEELRQATIHYRSVFEEMINEPSGIPSRIAS
jgi:ABC-type nickel/cobalt efflux system permease component RcnA